MSTLYIRLVSKAAADSAPHWPALACPFALVSHGSSIERQGAASLSELSDTVAKVQRVVLLLAASDVTLLRVKVPPLSPARLKTALPSLVEDQLIADPSDCVVVAGGLYDGLRTIAVAQRAWLDTLAKTLIASGARHIAALPAQLCLPYQSVQPGQSDQAGSVTAAIDDGNEGGQNAGIDMTLRLSEQDGIGLAIAPEKDEPAAHVALRALCAVVPEAPVSLYVPQSLVRAYQEAVNTTAELSKRISVSADNWSRWIAGANGTALDLMAGLGMATGPKLDWRPWRWPLALAAAILIVNAAALNIDWWRMKSETDSLRADMIRIYKSAYPKESVIIDPGIGFGKRLQDNLAILASLEEFVSSGYPVLVGLSRKSFLGAITGREVGERLPGTIAADFWAIWAGVSILRVHDVSEAVDTVKFYLALKEARNRRGIERE